VPFIEKERHVEQIPPLVDVLTQSMNKHETIPRPYESPEK
jgi:hypothetical protein